MGNYRKIIEHNKSYKKKRLKFKCELNRFADLTTEEFVESFTGLQEIQSDRRRMLRSSQTESNSFRFRLKAALYASMETQVVSLTQSDFHLQLTTLPALGLHEPIIVQLDIRHC
jgi:hypothetical protein